MDIKAFLKDKKNYPVFVIIICAVLVFFVFGGEKEPETTPNENPAREIEERLERVLSRVEGAGQVSVFISLEDYGVTDYAKDLKEGQNETEKKTVMQGSGSASTPVVSKVVSPKIKGVIVVTEGADNEYVRLNISEAVEAALAIMPHRIKILKG